MVYSIEYDLVPLEFPFQKVCRKVNWKSQKLSPLNIMAEIMSLSMNKIAKQILDHVWSNIDFFYLFIFFTHNTDKSQRHGE